VEGNLELIKYFHSIELINLENVKFLDEIFPSKFSVDFELEDNY
jgi:hypothetical protein